MFAVTHIHTNINACTQTRTHIETICKEQKNKKKTRNLALTKLLFLFNHKNRLDLVIPNQLSC